MGRFNTREEEFITLDFDVHSLETAFDDMAKSAQLATVNALNTVGGMANKEIAKRIKANFNVPSGSLRVSKGPNGDGLIRLLRADARKSEQHFGVRRASFKIRILKKPISLLEYSAHQGATGVVVRVKNSPKTIRHSFISSWKWNSDKRYVFVRDPKRGTYIRKRTVKTNAGRFRTQLSKRTMRRQLFGPSIAGLYASKASRQILAETINKHYETVLNEKFVKEYEK